MRRSTIEERFTRFVAEPTFERYLAVRELIQAMPEYDPYGGALEAIGPPFEAGAFRKVLRACDALGWEWCLSPRVHFWTGVAAQQQGDADRSAQAKCRIQACLQGLLSTGDGTQEQPFLVTYLSDEYDLLRCLSAAPVAGQELLDAWCAQCDVIHCRDGRQYWFDVTVLLATPRSSARRKSAAPARKTVAPPA